MSNSKSQTATGLVDAVNGRPVRRHPETGAYFVKASGAAHFWGRVLDAIVFLVGYGILATIVAVARNAMMNSGSLLAFNDGFWLTLYVVLWFVGLFVYGMIWGTAGSVVSVRAQTSASVLIDYFAGAGPPRPPRPPPAGAVPFAPFDVRNATTLGMRN